MRYAIDPGRSEVWIDGSSSVHPIHARATGLEGWVELADGRLGGEVRIEVARLRSGNVLVDRETRRRIDAGRFPLITGRTTSSDRGRSGSFALTGTVAFRGEERPVRGDVTVTTTTDGGLVVEGEQTFDVREWGLQPPRVGLLRVHPDIRVGVRIVASG